MIYIRKVNANEIGIRKAGKSRRAGSFLMVSKKCLDFLPTLDSRVVDDTVQIQYISPNGNEMGLVEYVWHNKSLHEEKSSRNEYRLYFNRELDSQSYLEPDDIVVMKRIREKNFDGIKIFLFKKERDKEFDVISKIIGTSTHSLHEKINLSYIDNYKFENDVSNSSKVVVDMKNEHIIHDHQEEIDGDIVAPSASSMVENLRSFGYSPSEAIADIVDNSISAGAKIVEVNIHWDMMNSFISVVDDGHGMTEKDLVKAMRPGSKNPSALRESTDLGRFGMGLKSASFSIGKQLTVISKQSSIRSVRRWDLDLICRENQWRVLKDPMKESSFSDKNLGDHGTAVVIENLDRLLSLNGSETIITDQDFYRIAEKIQFHLSLVFHRFITNKEIIIRVNDRAIKAFDPHFGHDQEKLLFTNDSIVGEPVKIRSFIVCREDELPVPTQRMLKRSLGFTQMQGVYIYRENRLITYGGWLNLGKRHLLKINDDYSLGRVIVELGNSTDKDWRLDIKKSTAHPPLSMLPTLNRAAEVSRKASSQNINKLANKTKKAENYEGIWSKSEKGIKVDRGNSLYRQLASDDDVGEKFMDYIKNLEKNIPV